MKHNVKFKYDPITKKPKRDPIMVNISLDVECDNCVRFRYPEYLKKCPRCKSPNYTYVPRIFGLTKRLGKLEEV